MQTSPQGRVALVSEAGSLHGICYAAAHVLGRDEMSLPIRLTTGRIHRTATVDGGNTIHETKG